MSHKFSTFFLLFACFLGMNTSLWGQIKGAERGIRGYLDPQTGSFHATPLPELDAAEAPALTTFGGKIIVTFTITVASIVPATSKIGCEVDASLSDGASGNFISETGASAVARGSASTVTCKVTIPYSWKLASAGTDMISMSYTITSPVAVSTAAAEFPLRISSQSIGSIKVPVTGTTTNETVAATI